MDELKKRYRLSVIIGAAIIASIFGYAVVVEILKRNAGPAPAVNLPEFIKYIPLAGAFLSLFLIGFIRKLILSAPLGPDITAEQKAVVLVQRLVTSSLIAYALSEAVAIYGLVIFMLTHRPADFYLALAGALALFLFYFPRLGQWTDWLKKQLEAS